jgi:hypothetical protein
MASKDPIVTAKDIRTGPAYYSVLALIDSLGKWFCG